MVCPLRFVLVGVSAAVALLVAFNTSWASAEPDPAHDLPSDCDTRCKKAGSGAAGAEVGGGSYLRLLLDMATGRYIYDLWQASRIKAA
eukprot:jgi/Tetstr1/425186/TSEL_015647.t1